MNSLEERGMKSPEPSRFGLISHRRYGTILSCLGLGGMLLAAGCVPVPLDQRPVFLPAGVYGVYEDNDLGAINQSAWAFAAAENLRGNPVDAAKAVVALEYLPAELRQNPRWIEVDRSVPFRMDQARIRVEAILGINPAAPRQLVVNALLAVAWDLQTGNQEAALAALRSPVFTLPAERTLTLLSNLPYVREANLSTARALAQASYGGGPRS